MKKHKALAFALALLGAAVAVYAQNVSSDWSGGDLYFYDVSGNAILQLDGTNRKLTIPSGSVLDLDAATGAVLFAAGEIVSADIADSTIVSADIAADTIAAADIAAGGVATSEILDGTILNEDVSASAAIARSKLAEDALQAYPIELRDASWAPLTASEAGGTFNVGVNSNVIEYFGEVTDNETETSVSWFSFMLPPEYVSAGDVSVSFRSILVVSAAPNLASSSIDLECYEQADGAVGADIVSTGAGSWAAVSTYETDTFALTASGLVAGDIVNCKLTIAVQDDEAGAGSITANFDQPKLLVDVKG